MASALRFAARKICGRSFQRLAQPYFTAAVKEEQRRLFPSISHGGSSVRRFCSSKTPNLVNNNKQALNSAPGAAADTQPTSAALLWSPGNKMFLPLIWGLSAAFCAAGYIEYRLMSPEWKEEPEPNWAELFQSEKIEYPKNKL